MDPAFSPSGEAAACQHSWTFTVIKYGNFNSIEASLVAPPSVPKTEECFTLAVALESRGSSYACLVFAVVYKLLLLVILHSNEVPFISSFSL